MNLEVGDFATLMLGGKKKNVRVVEFCADLNSGATWVRVAIKVLNRESLACVRLDQLTKINFVTNASKRRFAGQFEGR